MKAYKTTIFVKKCKSSATVNKIKEVMSHKHIATNGPQRGKSYIQEKQRKQTKYEECG